MRQFTEFVKNMYVAARTVKTQYAFIDSINICMKIKASIDAINYDRPCTGQFISAYFHS
jgi:hypothetical protein